MKFDFDHINPVTGLPRQKTRKEDKIQLMSRMPSRSTWILMLQNRVNLNSVGNMRFARKVWFDNRTKRVSENRSEYEAVFFKAYRLPNGQYPSGWIEVSDL